VTFGGWLKAELHIRDMSMSELARRIGTNPGTVSRWASDERTPDYKSCEAIARVLQHAPEVVLTEAGYTPFAQSRKQVLKREADHLEIRLQGIGREFRKLRREQEELSDRLEEVYREIMFAEDELSDESIEVVLSAIDNLALPEEAKDRLRNQVLDEVEAIASSGEQGANDGSPESQ
jgi:transcriptional regulator with XRE-family HTH domain